MPPTDRPRVISAAEMESRKRMAGTLISGRNGMPPTDRPTPLPSR